MSELLLGDEDDIHRFLYLRVVGLSIGQNLAHEVNGALHRVRMPLLMSFYYKHGVDHLSNCHDVG